MTASALPLPTKALLRRGDLRRAGFSRRLIADLIATKRLTPTRLTPHGRAFFLREEVARLVPATNRPNPHGH